MTNKVQGTGLGMAISKSIVDMMGGVINVESAPGEGSRFEVLLEFKVDAQADDRAHTVKDCRLLLVGYAPGRVADVQDALEHTPVTAEAVEHPEDAVSILRQEDVDVVLLSCQYRAPEMLRPLVRQMREAAGKPIFVFCMQAGSARKCWISSAPVGWTALCRCRSSSPIWRTRWRNCVRNSAISGTWTAHRC